MTDPHARRRTGVASLAAALTAIALASGVSPASAETTVSLSFDDGSADQMAAEQMLAAHGLRGTFFISPGRIGSGQYMSWADVATVSADGNEIGGHTSSHLDLTTLPPDQQRGEICGARKDLLARGYPQLSFAYPFGHYDANSEQLVEECGYLSGRGSGGLGEFAAESIPPLNRWAIRTRNSVTAADTLQTMEGWVLAAEGVDGGWLDLVFHHVCSEPTCPTPYSVTPSRLDAFLEWLRARELLGTHVRTVGEVIAANPQPLLSIVSVRSRRNGTARVTVYVGCSGDVRVFDPKRRTKLRPASLHARHAGVVRMTLEPNRAGRRALAKESRLREPAEVRFSPFAGTSTSESVRVMLKRRRSQLPT